MVVHALTAVLLARVAAPCRLLAHLFSLKAEGPEGLIPVLDAAGLHRTSHSTPSAIDTSAGRGQEHQCQGTRGTSDSLSTLPKAYFAASC